MKHLPILLAAIATLAVAGTVPAQQQAATQPKEGFRVTFTLENSAHWSRKTCWLDVDAGGQPEKITGPVTAQMECVGDKAFKVKETLSKEETEQFSRLVAAPDLWKGETEGRDPRRGDGAYTRLELKSDKTWTVVVVSGNPTFGRDAAVRRPSPDARPNRRDMMTLIESLYKRLNERGLGLSAGARQVAVSPEQDSGIEGTWTLFEEGRPSQPRFMVGLKKNGSEVIGYVLADAKTAPIASGRVDGNTVTFKNPLNGETLFTGKLEGKEIAFTHGSTKLVGYRLPRGQESPDTSPAR